MIDEIHYSAAATEALAECLKSWRSSSIDIANSSIYIGTLSVKRDKGSMIGEDTQHRLCGVSTEVLTSCWIPI